MKAFLMQTLPVPLWFVVLMVAAMIAWQFAVRGMTENLRDLFRLNWQENHPDEDCPI